MVDPIVILLVEDEPADARLTQIALEEAKFHNELHIATDGEAALDFLNRRGRHADAPAVDLVLLDLHLPRISGFEVLAEIRATPALQLLPVVVLTSSGAQTDVDETYRRQANCFVSKPVGVDQFLEVVTSIEQFWLSIVKRPSR